MSNHLKNEKSLYLQQHADNPVDWYPWSSEPFQIAKEKNKPILLSIGYSACHWCHVMAHESFENPMIAEKMNNLYICIKVDREERPDLDHIFQTAGQLLQVQGGWPLTVFMTPDGKPFYVGTYFPPEDRYGRPGFLRLMEFVYEAFKNQKEKVNATGNQISEMLKSVMGAGGATKPSASKNLDWTKISKDLWDDFDDVNGGFGMAPKFPHSTTYEILCRLDQSSKESQKRLKFGLEKMAQGGIYDHVGGGFHRYSTDDHWLVPHFEKMLYDNALIPRAYCDALFLKDTDLEFKRVIQETLHYVVREMQSPQGYFYAAQDADSSEGEGVFFTWPYDEIKSILNLHKASFLEEKLGISPGGNFEGRSLLHLREGWLNPKEREAFEKVKKDLFKKREQRAKPGRDEKCIVSWNGMMIRAFVQSALTLKDKNLIEPAKRGFEFIIKRISSGLLPGILYEDEEKSKGLLDDYVFMVDGALWLHQATGEMKYLEVAHKLYLKMRSLFWDEDKGLFAMNSEAADQLFKTLGRPVQTYDGAQPSGNAVALECVFWLWKLSGDEDLENIFKRMIQVMKPAIERSPHGFTTWLKTFWIETSGYDLIQVIQGDDYKYSFEKACELHQKRDLQNQFILWMGDSKVLAQSLIDPWEHHQRKGLSGFILCGPSGCQPITQ